MEHPIDTLILAVTGCFNAASMKRECYLKSFILIKHVLEPAICGLCSRCILAK